MAPIAEGVAVGAAAAAQQHGGGSTQVQLMGHPAGAEVGAIAKPTMAAAATAAQQMHPRG